MSKITFTQSISILTNLKRVFGLNIAKCHRRSVKIKYFSYIRKRFSVLWIIYAFLLHCMYMSSFGKSLSFTMNVKVSILDFGVEVMFTVIGALSMLITIIWNFKNTTRLSMLKDSIDKFDKQFSMLGKAVDNKLVKSFAIWEVVVVLLFWTFYFCYYVIWDCDVGTKTCLKNWFVIYHPHKILLVAFLEEVVLLYAVTLRFRCLNDAMSNMQTDIMFEMGETKCFVAYKGRTSSKMVHCRELHYYLCDLCAELNDMHSLQTVANILDCFVNIFVSLYLVCYGYSRDIESTGADQKPLGIFLPLYLGSESFAKIFCLAKYCDSVQREAKKMGAIIHKMSMYSLNDELKNETLHFSQQILHKNVQITACGMFPIDYSLIYNIIAAVTTFIVILIQFALVINSPIPTGSSAITPRTNFR